MVVPFLPFYIRELGITNQDELEHWSGIVFSGPFILSFLLTPVWGVLRDKFGKKPWSSGQYSNLQYHSFSWDFQEMLSSFSFSDGAGCNKRFYSCFSCACFGNNA